jgi:hypothetical protein
MGTMYNILQFLKQQKEILITKNKTAFCQWYTTDGNL